LPEIAFLDTWDGVSRTNPRLRTQKVGKKEHFAYVPEFRALRAPIDGKNTKKVWSVTVIVRTFLRYSSMSDIFGLAYLVGQIED
jgi:hypothetical protein